MRGGGDAVTVGLEQHDDAVRGREGRRQARAIGDIYRQCYDIYKTLPGVYAGSIEKGTAAEQDQQQRVADSADFLADHMGEAPGLVIACTRGRSMARRR